MLLAVLILLIFLLFAVLMYTQKLPAILALPLMAIFIAAAAQVPLNDILVVVISNGSYRLGAAITVMFFGAILGQFVNKSGIAETMIKKAAELGGDRPLVVSLILGAVTALLFTVLGGLGAVIMVATIVLPILLSVGVPPMVAGCLFLLGLSLGGVLNLTNWQLYISVLGLSIDQIMPFALPLTGIFLVVTVLFLVIEMKREGRVRLWAEWEASPKRTVSWLALLTPLVPLVLVFGFSLYNLLAHPPQPFEFPIITALLFGLFYGVVTVYRRGLDMVNLLSQSIIEGIASVAPAVALIIGIGMLLNAVAHPQVAMVISPILAVVMPTNPLSYVLFFVLLSPLALYRGPLNIWGMGSGLIGLMLATRSLPAVAIMAALMAVGQIQGVCDPTNTHNVWIANFLKIDVQDILKRTIIYVWLIAVFGLILGAVMYFR